MDYKIEEDGKPLLVPKVLKTRIDPVDKMQVDTDPTVRFSVIFVPRHRRPDVPKVMFFFKQNSLTIQ